MSANIQNLIDLGANVVLQVTASDLKMFADEIIRSISEQKGVNDKTEEYLTVKETAELLHVDKSTLHRWAKSGYLLPVEVGGRRLYKKSGIERMMGGQ